MNNEAQQITSKRAKIRNKVKAFPKNSFTRVKYPKLLQKQMWQKIKDEEIQSKVNRKS